MSESIFQFFFRIFSKKTPKIFLKKLDVSRLRQVRRAVRVESRKAKMYCGKGFDCRSMHLIL